jgi:HAD superfamily hydrolase (TIGR01509 family)
VVEQGSRLGLGENRARSARGNGSIPIEQIEWIFFDLDGTLRHNRPNGMDAFHQMAAEAGLALTAEERQDVIRWNYAYWADSDELRADTTQAEGDLGIRWQLYTRRHLQAIGAPEERLDDLAEVLRQRMADEYHAVDVVPEDVEPTLRSLRAAGFRLALISNRTEPIADVAADLALDHAFEFTLAAGEVGWWKPDPRLLRYAAERAKVRPPAAVYVGDNPYADVAGARNAGLHPVLIDSDDLFPGVDCPRIRRIGELEGLFEIDQ